MSRKTTLIEVGCDSDSPDVGDDILGNMPEHSKIDLKGECVVAREKSLSEVGFDTESLDVGNDVGSRIEQDKVKDDLLLVKLYIRNSSKCLISLQR